MPGAGCIVLRGNSAFVLRLRRAIACSVDRGGVNIAHIYMLIVNEDCQLRKAIRHLNNRKNK